MIQKFLKKLSLLLGVSFAGFAVSCSSAAKEAKPTGDDASNLAAEQNTLEQSKLNSAEPDNAVELKNSNAQKAAGQDNVKADSLAKADREACCSRFEDQENQSACAAAYDKFGKCRKYALISKIEQICCGEDDGSESFETCIAEYKTANNCTHVPRGIDLEEMSAMYGMPVVYEDLPVKEKVQLGGL